MTAEVSRQIPTWAESSAKTTESPGAAGSHTAVATRITGPAPGSVQARASPVLSTAMAQVAVAASQRWRTAPSSSVTGPSATEFTVSRKATTRPLLSVSRVSVLEVPVVSVTVAERGRSAKRASVRASRAP